MRLGLVHDLTRVELPRSVGSEAICFGPRPGRFGHADVSPQGVEGQSSGGSPG
jgi:hypothetical protein